MNESDNNTGSGSSGFRHSGIGQFTTFNCLPCGKNKRQLGSKRRRYAGALISVCAQCAEAMDKRAAKRKVP
jgi:hypothetical protein